RQAEAHAYFHAANFTGADLSDANFDGVNFLIAQNKEGNTLPGSVTAGVTDAQQPTQLVGANCSNWPSVNFSNADMTGTHLKSANLQCANFYKSKMDSTTELDGADLKYASFCQATLRGVDFTKAVNVDQALFIDANLEGA